jgi:hypothetical protein
LTTLFEGYEMCERNPARELIDLIAGRAPWLLALATRMLRTLFDGLAGVEAPDDGEESDDGAEVE